MSLKERDKANTTRAGATMGSVCTIHKYTIPNTSNTFQINHQQHACRADKYENVRAQAVTIESSRRQDREPSTLRTF